MWDMVHTFLQHRSLVEDQAVLEKQAGV
jgi:hypothetical protein